MASLCSLQDRSRDHHARIDLSSLAPLTAAYARICPPPICCPMHNSCSVLCRFDMYVRYGPEAHANVRLHYISTAMKAKFHRGRGKLGLFAARRLSLRRCHRMLTASIVASSLIVPLAVVEPAWPNELEQARTPPKPSTCDRSQFRLILDVGHTAEAPGAISARNVPEYDFNLRLAAHLKQSLIEDGFNKTVLLVTGGSARPSLFKRAAKANGLSANLRRMSALCALRISVGHRATSVSCRH